MKKSWPLLDAEDLLDLRFGLEQEILRRSAADHNRTGLVAAPFRVQHDGRAFIDVDARLTRSLLPRSSTPATFMPMVESPGDDVKHGTPAR